MLSYNILNDFVEKLKSGNVTPDDLVKVGNAVKNADLQVKYEVENIKAIPSDILNEVKCGDVIAKKTGLQYHCYIVTYKQENVGICLTYFDASVLETQSYDYVTDAWVYNSEDKTNIIYTAGTGINITNGQISADTTVLQEKLTAGNNITITDDVISASGGGKFYHHKIILTCTTGSITTSGYENFLIDIVMEVFKNNATTPSAYEAFQNVKKEFMSGIIHNTSNTEVYQILDGYLLSFNLENNGYIYIDKSGLPTLLNLSNSIQSTSNVVITSLGYDEVNVQ